MLTRIYGTAFAKKRKELINKYLFDKLQVIRFLDDWAYQANVRGRIEVPCDISEQMNPFEEKLLRIFGQEDIFKVKYIYPWDRKFEVEISLN